MANQRRGEAPLEIAGRRLALKLTLGGLAEMEDLFGAGSLAALGERFGQGALSARQLIGILRIGLAGAGYRLSDDEINALTLEDGLQPVVTAVARMFVLTFGEPESSPDSP